MDKDKSPNNQNGESPSEDSSPADDSSSESSMFSRNLELKAAPASRGELPIEQPEPQMEATDRKVYFGVEAGKVIDILNEEFQRLDQRQSSSPVLVVDLHSSWKALWGDDDTAPVKDFTGMFEAACKALSSASRLERKLEPQERETLVTLLQAMSRLASGEEDQDFLLQCRTARDECLRLNEELNQQVEISGEPAESEPENEKAEDITSSVDEWFTQVSSLVMESAGEGTDSGQQQESLQPQEPESGQQQIESPQEDIIQPSPVPGKPLSEDFEEVAAPSGEQAAKLPPETEEKPERKQKPLEEEPDLFAEQQTQPAAADEEVITEAPTEIAAAAPVSGEKISQQPEEAAPEVDSQDYGSANTAEIVGLYFSQQCREMIEVFKHNLSRLSGPSCRRTSRMLSRHLEQMVELSEDFGYEACNQSLIKMRKLLYELASAGNGENVLLRRDLEGLQTVVAELEREL
jgi:hypothetical protein